MISPTVVVLFEGEYLNGFEEWICIHVDNVQEKLDSCSAHLEHRPRFSHRIDCMNTMKYRAHSMVLEVNKKLTSA